MKINIVGEYELERFFEELKKLDKHNSCVYDDVMIGYAMGAAYIDLTDAKEAMIKFILANKNLFVKEDEEEGTEEGTEED